MQNYPSLFFSDGKRSIDFVLVYKESTLSTENKERLEYFLDSILRTGLDFEIEPFSENIDIIFVKLHGPKDVIVRYSDICDIDLSFRIKDYRPTIPPRFNFLATPLTKPNPEDEVYRRAPESVSGQLPTEVTSAEKIMVLHKILTRTKFGAEYSDYGIDKLLRKHVFIDAYPLHDGPYKWTTSGPLTDRQLLFKFWASPGCWYKEQPLKLIEKYFGTEVGFYFAYCGFYQQMLVPAAIMSLLCVTYGLVTMFNTTRNVERFLITGTTYKHLGHEFKVGYSTVSEIVKETCPIIWEELVERHMPVPSQQQLLEVIEDYNARWNFPNCFGPIDGKHCQIKCPPNTGTTYFNYLKYYSIGLQAVADAQKTFTIEVGARGSESDGGVFQSSILYNLLELNQFNVPPDNTLPNTNVLLPNVMIGDEAYPLKRYLLRPYPRPRNGVLDNEKQIFNDRLSRARKCIEDAFGILYQKFRIFDTSILLKKETAVNVIKCACILHNLIRDLDGNEDTDYEQIVNRTEGQQRKIHLHVRNNRASNLATQIRDLFKDYFCNNNHLQ